jgi:hypothetical protein
MHPELVQALARGRQADLLRDQQARLALARASQAGPLGEPRARLIDGGSPPLLARSHKGVVHRLRRPLGSALVRAGTWLMAGRRATVDLSLLREEPPLTGAGQSR